MEFLIAPGVPKSLVDFIKNYVETTNKSRNEQDWYENDSVNTELLSTWLNKSNNENTKNENILNGVKDLEECNSCVAQNRCIIQFVHISEFVSMRKNRFSIEKSGDNICSNPLLFRRELSEIIDVNDIISACFSLPIIFIGDFALFYRLGFETGVKDEDVLKKDMYNKKYLRLPKLVYPPGGSDKMFLDSSIWHRYIPLWELGRFSSYISEIKKLIKLRIYQTTVALEDLDYSIRMLKNQYVKDLDNGHGRQIAVHGFHSESRANSVVESSYKNERQHEYSGKNKNFGNSSMNNCNYTVTNDTKKCTKKSDKTSKTQIRILLVDDFSNLTLRLSREGSEESININNNPTPGFPPTKKDIVKRLFSLLKTEEIQVDIKVYTAANFDMALIKMKKKKFDIILLDYLFSIDSNSRSLNTPLYGTDFLNKLEKNVYDIRGNEKRAEDKQNGEAPNKKKTIAEKKLGKNELAKKSKVEETLAQKELDKEEEEEDDFTEEKISITPKKGPGEHFWILPATVFPEAIRSEVDSANVSQDEAEYTLFSGADPVCTPELFKYKFLKMLETIIRKLTPTLEPFYNLLEKLTIMKIDQTNITHSSIGVRSECRKYFHRIVNQCARYTQLQEDKKDHSLLADSILDKKNKMIGELLVRIQSFLNEFIFGGDQKWGILHLEFEHISKHPLIVERIKNQNEVKMGLEIFLDEINKKAERG